MVLSDWRLCTREKGKSWRVRKTLNEDLKKEFTSLNILGSLIVAIEKNSKHGMVKDFLKIRKRMPARVKPVCQQAIKGSNLANFHRVCTVKFPARRDRKPTLRILTIDINISFYNSQHKNRSPWMQDKIQEKLSSFTTCLLFCEHFAFFNSDPNRNQFWIRRELLSLNGSFGNSINIPRD